MIHLTFKEFYAECGEKYKTIPDLRVELFHLIKEICPEVVSYNDASTSSDNHEFDDFLSLVANFVEKNGAEQDHMSEWKRGSKYLPNEFRRGRANCVKAASIHFYMLSKTDYLKFGEKQNLKVFKKKSTHNIFQRTVRITGKNKFDEENSNPIEHANISENWKQEGYEWVFSGPTQIGKTVVQNYTCSLTSAQTPPTDSWIEILSEIYMRPMELDGYQLGFKSVELVCVPTNGSGKLNILGNKKYDDYFPCKNAYYKLHGSKAHRYAELKSDLGALNGEYMTTEHSLFKICPNQDSASLHMRLTAKSNNTNIDCIAGKVVPHKNKLKFIELLLQKEFVQELIEGGDLILQEATYSIRAVPKGITYEID